MCGRGRGQLNASGIEVCVGREGGVREEVSVIERCLLAPAGAV